jgi:hypothetical protein
MITHTHLYEDTHNECHGHMQRIEYSMESIFLMHHGNVYIQERPRTPKVCEEGNDREESIQCEIVLRLFIYNTEDEKTGTVTAKNNHNQNCTYLQIAKSH